MAKDLDFLKKIIGKNIKRYRKAFGYTQKDLGIQADLNELYISQIERGVGIPSINALFKIANVLNKNIKDFFEEEV